MICLSSCTATGSFIDKNFPFTELHFELIRLATDHKVICSNTLCFQLLHMLFLWCLLQSEMQKDHLMRWDGKAVDMDADAREELVLGSRFAFGGLFLELFSQFLVLELHILLEAAAMVHRIGILRLYWLLKRQMPASGIRHSCHRDLLCGE